MVQVGQKGGGVIMGEFVASTLVVVVQPLNHTFLWVSREKETAREIVIVLPSYNFATHQPNQLRQSQRSERKRNLIKVD